MSSSKLLVALFLGLTAFVPLANSKIPKFYIRAEAAYHVPAKVFYALALTESSTTMTNNDVAAWPYSLNVRGHGYHFKSQYDLIKACEKLLKKGLQSFDIGLFQINYKWHHKKVRDWKLITNPYINTSLAAGILIKQFKKNHNWYITAGKYHSPHNQREAIRYMKLFAKNLDKIENDKI